MVDVTERTSKKSRQLTAHGEDRTCPRAFCSPVGCLLVSNPKTMLNHHYQLFLAR